MEIQHSTKDGCRVVTLSGSINLFSVPQIQRALLKDLGGKPLAVICDLAGVQQLDPVCATVFATVANHPSSSWPATSFLLCGAQPPVAEILGLLTVPHSLQLYASLEDALDAAVARPPSLRDEAAPGGARWQPTDGAPGHHPRPRSRRWTWAVAGRPTRPRLGGQPPPRRRQGRLVHP
jgi:anti-anti-sigma regulatory factor